MHPADTHHASALASSFQDAAAPGPEGLPNAWQLSVWYPHTILFRKSRVVHADGETVYHALEP